MSKEKIRAEIVVTGLVQGVGFRYFVYREAEKLGVTGSVRNLYDGNVFVIAEGDKFKVDELIKKVKVGPMHAHVKDTNVKLLEPKNDYSRFEIDY